jgi:hypothetical protein
MPTSPRSQEVSADQPDNVFINLVVHCTFTEACLITCVVTLVITMYIMFSNQYLCSDSKQLRFAQQHALTGAVDMVLLKLSAPSLGYP